MNITTLQLWSLLREPVSAELRKLLRLDQTSRRAWWWYVLALLIFICAPFTVVILMLVIVNFLCLQRARTIANMLSTQSQSGQYDLLAATPIGGMGLVLSVARAYFRSMCYSVASMAKIWALMSGGVVVILLVFGAQPIEIVQAGFLMAMLIAALFVDYMQSVASAALIGIFAGITADSTKAQVTAFAAFFSLQIFFYVGIVLVSVTLFFSISARTTLVEMLLLFVAPFWACFAIREGVITFVWRQIRERINDDVPILNIQANRG